MEYVIDGRMKILRRRGTGHSDANFLLGHPPTSTTVVHAICHRSLSLIRNFEDGEASAAALIKLREWNERKWPSERRECDMEV